MIIFENQSVLPMCFADYLLPSIDLKNIQISLNCDFKFSPGAKQQPSELRVEAHPGSSSHV